MKFPIKTCVKCGEEFELKPGKPGFANQCPECSEPEEAGAAAGGDVLKGNKEAEAERRRVMREMLYKKDA